MLDNKITVKGNDLIVNGKSVYQFQSEIYDLDMYVDYTDDDVVVFRYGNNKNFIDCICINLHTFDVVIKSSSYIEILSRYGEKVPFIHYKDNIWFIYDIKKNEDLNVGPNEDVQYLGERVFYLKRKKKVVDWDKTLVSDKVFDNGIQTTLSLSYNETPENIYINQNVANDKLNVFYIKSRDEDGKEAFLNIKNKKVLFFDKWEKSIVKYNGKNIMISVKDNYYGAIDLETFETVFDYKYLILAPADRFLICKEKGSYRNDGFVYDLQTGKLLLQEKRLSFIVKIKGTDPYYLLLYSNAKCKVASYDLSYIGEDELYIGELIFKKIRANSFKSDPLESDSVRIIDGFLLLRNVKLRPVLVSNFDNNLVVSDNVVEFIDKLQVNDNLAFFIFSSIELWIPQCYFKFNELQKIFTYLAQYSERYQESKRTIFNKTILSQILTEKEIKELKKIFGFKKQDYEFNTKTLGKITNKTKGALKEINVDVKLLVDNSGLFNIWKT